MSVEALQIGELTRRTGLTIRTLHHYDEIGLLRPSLRTPAGYRLYTVTDVARLQQVLSLRQLGFSLDEIRACLDQPGFSPTAVIERHLARLREQIALAQQLSGRLETLADHLRAAGEVSAEEFLQTIEVMTMIENLYTPEQRQQFQELAARVGPEEIRAIEEAWTAMLADVHAQSHLDPASAEAQTLVVRWDELTARTMRHYEPVPELKQAIGEHYKQGHFEGHSRAPQAADLAFIERARQAGAKGQNP